MDSGRVSSDLAPGRGLGLGLGLGLGSGPGLGSGNGLFGTGGLGLPKGLLAGGVRAARL